MLRRTLIGIGLIAGTLVPAPAQAATLTIELHNHYFQPTALLAAPGDTIVLRNLGGRKVVQSWSNEELPATTVETNQTISFVFTGPNTGLRADDLDPATPALSSVQNNVCSGMCGRVTTTAPENLPQTPVITSPAANSTVGNTVTFSGTAVAASKVRIRIPSVSVIRTANVDGTGAWSLQHLLGNGSYTATATSIHPDGFESSSASVSFAVSGGDTQAPRILAGIPASVGGQPTPVKYGTIFVGHGAVKATGVVVDDVSAKKVTATVKDALLPDTEVAIALRCTVEGSDIPCDSSSNPGRIQYAGSFLPPRPGHYIVTTTAVDGVGATTTTIQDVVILSPL